MRKIDSQAELWIGLGPGQTAKNKAAFKALEAQKAAIEADFGGQLDWQELPEGEGCRVRYVIEGGYKSPPDQWPAIYAALADAMARLEKAMRARVASLAHRRSRQALATMSMLSRLNSATHTDELVTQ